MVTRFKIYFGGVKLAKNAHPDKHTYTGYRNE